MEYRVLKYFLAVAQEENITKAAQILHISQPALSRQLMQLEDELGTKLFERGKRNIKLTEAGALLRRRAEEIVDLTDKAAEEIKRQDKEVGGTITIGSGEAETTRVLAKLMRGFSEIYPAVKFELYSNNADQLKEKLDRGLLDFAILLQPSDVSGYEHLWFAQKERWGAFVPSDCPLAKKDYITAGDLINKKILASKRMAALGVKEWLGEVYDKLDIYVTYNLLYNAAILVDCGIGAALAIEGAGALYKNSNIVFKPFYPELTVSSVLVWKKHQSTSVAVKKFIEYIKQNVNETGLL